MIETWLARTFIVIIAALMLFVAGAGVGVFVVYLRRFRSGVDPSFNTQGWTAMTVSVILVVLLAAVMDVGQAFLLVTDGWPGLVAITGTILLPVLGYKSVQQIAANNKNGPTNITGS